MYILELGIESMLLFILTRMLLSIGSHECVAARQIIFLQTFTNQHSNKMKGVGGNNNFSKRLIKTLSRGILKHILTWTNKAQMENQMGKHPCQCVSIPQEWPLVA